MCQYAFHFKLQINILQAYSNVSGSLHCRLNLPEGHVWSRLPQIFSQISFKDWQKVVQFFSITNGFYGLRRWAKVAEANDEKSPKVCLNHCFQLDQKLMQVVVKITKSSPMRHLNRSFGNPVSDVKWNWLWCVCLYEM